MDQIILIIGIVLAALMFLYFISVYRNQRLTPDKVEKLHKEYYDALLEAGVKDIYKGLDDVPLMDEFKSLDQEKVSKGQIAKLLEVSCKQEIIKEIFDERGIEFS